VAGLFEITNSGRSFVHFGIVKTYPMLFIFQAALLILKKDLLSYVLFEMYQSNSQKVKYQNNDIIELKTGTEST
jgi:Ni2+-binding GTPase involved in maturation of urease and hydrogenase